MSIYIRINKEDCQEITSSHDNGLLELVVPKDVSNADLNKYLNSISSEFAVIQDEQKKTTEIFRKKVRVLIEKYVDEFKIDNRLSIKLRLQTKTRKLNDCNVSAHGITFDANMDILGALQYLPDDVVEQIVRCTVYMIACEYEELWSNIKNFNVGKFTYPDKEEIVSSSKIPEEEKYHLNISYDEVQKIKADYAAACQKFSDLMQKAPISYIG